MEVREVSSLWTNVTIAVLALEGAYAAVAWAVAFVRTSTES